MRIPHHFMWSYSIQYRFRAIPAHFPSFPSILTRFWPFWVFFEKLWTIFGQFKALGGFETWCDHLWEFPIISCALIWFSTGLERFRLIFPHFPLFWPVFGHFLYFLRNFGPCLDTLRPYSVLNIILHHLSVIQVLPCGFVWRNIRIMVFRQILKPKISSTGCTNSKLAGKFF